MNHFLSRKTVLPAVMGVAGLLSACGGGGGGVVETPPPAPVMTSVPVTVIDGAIQNAVVCLDKNANNLCDTDEPSGKTDAAGNVTLQVEEQDAGKFAVLAIVGTDAIDADHGPVTTPFTMKAPADKPAVVSPLTTLVQTTIETTGATTAAAEAAVQTQIGVNVSLFEDFTKGTSAESANLGTIARMVVVTTQEQTKVLADAVGTQAIDGSTITASDLAQAVNRKLLEVLADVVAILADPRVQDAASAQAKAEAMAAVAQELVADPDLGLTTTALQTVVAIAKQTDKAPDTAAPAAGGNMAALNYADSNNWFRRMLVSSLAQNTPDAGGMTRFVDRRQRSNTGVIASWNTGTDPNRQSDFHFNGTSWVQCGLNQESASSVRDAQGRSTYEYCDKRETGASSRATFDIAGKAMKDVYKQIRDGGFTNITIEQADGVLGVAAFPADSKLFYQSNTSLTSAPSYYPGLGSMVRNANAQVAAGVQSACAPITPSTPQASYNAFATTLDSIVAANRGTPCVYGPNHVITLGNGTQASSGSRNEWWSQSTLSIGQLGTAPTGGNAQTAYYTTNTLLRVAFTADNGVKYYSCRQRASDGSSRNCDVVGTGSYSVQALGDGKVMTLANPPALFAGLTYNRVFVERGGRVFFGYQNKLATTTAARLNLTASNALSAQLGLPAVDPATPLALTAASYQGDWMLDEAGMLDVNHGITVRLSGNGGAASCTENENGQAFDCTVTVDPATGGFNFTDAEGTATGTLRFVEGTVSGTFTATGEEPHAVDGRRR